MENGDGVEEDWDLLVSFFPPDWRDLALRSGALKGLRQDKSEEKLLRVLLLHVGCGLSMRETVVRARQAHLADLSAVALLKRLRKSEDWLQNSARLCCALFEERGIQIQPPPKQRLRLIDSTLVKEPGKTGSQWRIHYSLQWPTLACDYFKITATCRGDGNWRVINAVSLQGDTITFWLIGVIAKASGLHYASA